MGGGNAAKTKSLNEMDGRETQHEGVAKATPRLVETKPKATNSKKKGGKKKGKKSSWQSWR